MTQIGDVKRVHMIGVGGSSMSGLAGLLRDEGYEVSGSDRTRSHKTEALEARGVKVLIGHRPENVRGAQLVVYSAAIAPDNPERAEAARLGIPQMERCDLIGQLMKGSECAIAVSGTHGKTTTTSMLAQVFLTAGRDPSVHIGGELDFLGGSTRRGRDEFILEACEYNRSFLHFYPTVAVILNIDEDHLDCYKDIDDIEAHVFAVRAPGQVHRRLGRRCARKARHRRKRPSPHHLRAGRGKHAAAGRALLRRTRPRPLHRPLGRETHRRIRPRRARRSQHARRAGRHRRGASAQAADGRGFRGAAQLPRRAPAQRTDQRHRRREGVYRLRPQPRRDQIGAGHRRHGAAQDPLGRVAAAHLFAHQDAV